MAWSIAYIDGSIKLSDDDLVNGFFNQMPRPENIERQSHLDSLELNLHKAQTLCEQVYQFADSKGIKCTMLRLKVDSIDKFAGIIYLNESDFNSTAFTEIQVYTGNLLTKINRKKGFQISLVHLPDNIEVNEEKLISEGYILSYNPAAE